MTVDRKPQTPTELTRLDGVRRISNSEVQTFKRCRRKWWFAYFRGLAPRTESAVGPLAVGVRVHAALQHHYESRVPGVAHAVDARDALEALIVRDRELLGRSGDVTDELVRQFNNEADLERIMIDGYLQWLADSGEDANYEVIGAEVYREADVPELNVKLVARLDLRVRRLSDSLTLFLDHKTCAAFDPLIRALPMNEQMLWYILIELLAASTDETPAQGALYNMLRKVKRTARAKPPFYVRHTVDHNYIELRSFYTRVLGMVETILAAEARLNAGVDHRRVVYPSPTRDCVWDCPFNAVCRLTDDGSYVEEMIERFFTVADPMSYYARGQSMMTDHARERGQDGTK